MKSLFTTIGSINHLISFKSGDKVCINTCISSDNGYVGFRGTIKSINLIKRTDNGRGVIKLKSQNGGELELNGIVGKLELKKIN